MINAEIALCDAVTELAFGGGRAALIADNRGDSCLFTKFVRPLTPVSRFWSMLDAMLQCKK